MSPGQQHLARILADEGILIPDEKDGNAAIFRQNDHRFRNYIMAWQKKGTDRGLLPAAKRSQSAVSIASYAASP